MLYISNTTKHHHRVCFRIPEHNRFQVVEIPSGHQVALGKTWSQAQRDAVIKQLQTYGAREVNEKLERVTGLLYRVEKVVKSEEILEGHAAVVDMQERRSAAEATKSALAFDQSSRKGGRRVAKITEVEVVQDLPPKTRPSGDEIKMRVSVEPDGGKLSLPS